MRYFWTYFEANKHLTWRIFEKIKRKSWHWTISLQVSLNHGFKQTLRLVVLTQRMRMLSVKYTRNRKILFCYLTVWAYEERKIWKFVYLASLQCWQVINGDKRKVPIFSKLSEMNYLNFTKTFRRFRCWFLKS